MLPGISGSLFPVRYLADGVPDEAIRAAPDAARLDRTRRQLDAWWARAAAACGPATGVRALFDLVAMPLFARLGFRARDATFERRGVHVRLETARGTPVGLVVLPWASRPSTLWRDAVDAARSIDADWCFVLAPPFLSLVEARGHAFRRSVDFTLPDAFDHRSILAFWTLTHASSFDPADRRAPRGAPGDSPLDTLMAAAIRYQDRVREDLQDGVVDALHTLVRVLPPDAARVDGRGRFDEALTLVYRVLFLLFAESRDLVPRGHPVYRGAYSLGTLCREASTAGPAVGLWDALAAITRLSRAGCRTDDLIVRPFNGRLFARDAAPTLEAARPSRRAAGSTTIRNAAMQRTLVALATRPGRAGREPISYTDLGVEQLGAVYERVLDLDLDTLAGDSRSRRASEPSSRSRRASEPSSRSRRASEPSSRSRRASALRSGSRPGSTHSLHRKQTGTFYTPRALAEFVVRRTLAPLVASASSDAILELRVVDPAMGSGAFLVAACRYLAAAYERALVDEGRCAESDLDDAERANIRRLVAERCLAGVDANPVAVQLARLSLWLATLAQGKPLGFLDHRLRVGNSLVGASPDDLRRMAGRRRPPAAGARPLFDDAVEHALGHVSGPLLEMLARRDDTVDDVRGKEAVWTRLTRDRASSDGLGRLWLAASLWCARWFWPGGVGAPVPNRVEGPPSDAEARAAIDALVKNDATLREVHLSRWLTTARSIATTERFFHWPLEFADVFYDEHGRPRPRPGFDAVLGNPPWEMLRHDGSSAAERGSSARSSLVRFIRESGLYPSCDRGHVNLYQPFLERALTLTRPGGRVGLIAPWGLAADDGAAALRARLLDRSAIDTIVGVDNAHGLFPIHRGLRFLVVVASPGGVTREAQARFGVKTSAEIDELPDGREAAIEDTAAYPVRISPGLIERVGGRTRRIPDVRRPSDLELIERLSREHPRLGSHEGWAAQFGRELNVTDDRASFGAVGLPIVEGKHIQPFAVEAESTPYRIDPAIAARLLPDRRFECRRLAYRDVSGVGNRLALIAAVLPAGVVTTHTLFCLRTSISIEQQHFLCGLFNSYVLNAIVRLLMGGHLTTSLVESLPVPAWRGSAIERRIARLARRLSTRPTSPSVHAQLQADVARVYLLDEAAFLQVLDGSPLVPAEDRRLAALAWRRPAL